MAGQHKKSKYKHVTWHTSREQWLVQIPRLKVYKLFSSEMEAARYSQEVAGVEAKGKQRVRADHRARTCPVGNKYKYVSWRANRKRWLAHIPDSMFQYFESQDEAVRAAAACLGTTRSKLLIGADHQGPGNFSAHNTRGRKRKLFEELWYVYSHTSTRCRCSVVPGDLSASLVHHTKSKQMYATDPGLLVCSLRGKELAWKDALLRCWKAAQPHDMKGVFEVLQKALACMASPANKTRSDLWQKHVNRNVTHHSGWLPMAQNLLPLLQKVKRESSGVLVFGTGGLYKPLQFSAKFVDAYTKFRKVGLVLRTLPVVKSGTEWAEELSSATASAAAIGLRSTIKQEYSWPWLVRTQLFAMLRSSGVRKLTTANLTSDQLATMNPDMHQHVEDLAEHSLMAADVLKSVKYDGPPELFSMYCCLFISSPEKFDPKAVRSSRAALIQAREKFTEEHGIPPHPLLLLEAVLH